MVLRIETRKPRNEECETLAEVAIAERSGTPLESQKTLNEHTQDIERIANDESYEIVIATEDEIVVGWIYYYLRFKPMAFISGFSPIIEPRAESERIALALIEAVKKNIIDRGYTRLEIEFVLQSEEHYDLSKKYVEWYKKADFRFAAEEIHMQADLSALTLPRSEIPSEYTTHRFADVPSDRLEEPGFQAFESSEDRLFTSMNHAEQQITLRHFFDKSIPFVDDASLVIEKEDRIVGFIITRRRSDVIEIGPIGLVPEARRKGLGTYLLSHALYALEQCDELQVNLDVSVENTHARKLYTKCGFKPEYRKQFYYWSP